MKINKIGIKFSDNDFAHTIGPYLSQLAWINKNTGHRSILDFTKEEFVEFYNMTILAFYTLYQNRLEYTNGATSHTAHQESLREYLKIRTIHVLFNEEVDEYIESRDGWDNGEFFYGHYCEQTDGSISCQVASI